MYKEWAPGLILHVLKQRGFVDTERWIAQPAVQICLVLKTSSIPKQLNIVIKRKAVVMQR